MSVAEAYLRPTERPTAAPGTRLTAEQQAVVESNMGLISIVVKPGAANYDDSYQNAVFGLARAAQKFDPAKGFAFSTYAMYWIRQAVQRGNLIGSEHGFSNANRAHNNGVALGSLVQLDAPIGDDGTASLGDVIPDNVDVEDEALQRAGLVELTGRLERLCVDDIDRALLAALLEPAPPSLPEIAARLGINVSMAMHRRQGLSARARHPVYRNQIAPKELSMTITEPTANGTHATAVTRTFDCPECPRTFIKPQGLGRHRFIAHGVPGKTSVVASTPKQAKAGTPPEAERPKSEKPKLDSESVKAALAARDDFDPWLVVVGTMDDTGPGNAVTVVVSTCADADRVAGLLVELGHRPFVFRLEDGRRS